MFKLKKVILVILLVVLVIFVGVSTYSHINGTENLISPILRVLGINSKYEENATQFTEEEKENEVTVKMLDGTLNDTSLIVEYEINVQGIEPETWIEVYGDYTINNISTKPIDSMLEKISDTSYIYYQIFDVNEIKINDEEVKIEAIINEIKEYTKSEELNSEQVVYGKIHNIHLDLQENIAVKNLEESKIYEFENTKKYEILENVSISATTLLKGSYINILNLSTDKTEYTGDAFEKYYKILDSKNNEIATYSEEERQYDERKYNDRIILKNTNSKITVEVYLKMIDEENYKKVASIPVDLEAVKEKKELSTNMKQYQNENFSLKYKENWNLIEKLDADRVGPNSIYLGALELEIPSTTNSERTSSIFVKMIDKDYSLDEYKKQIRKEYKEPPYYEELSSSEKNIGNKEGYQLIASTTDGETQYIEQTTFTNINGKIYRITFFASEKEYNNLKNDIEEFLNNFEI